MQLLMNNVKANGGGVSNSERGLVEDADVVESRNGNGVQKTWR